MSAPLSGSATQEMKESSPSTKEPPVAHSGAEHNGSKGSTDDRRTEQDVEHLHAVTPAATTDEAIRVVGSGKLLALRYRHFQEVAERFPALAHLVFEQVLRWDERADLLVVLLEAALAVLLKVAFPEAGPEFWHSISVDLLQGNAMDAYLTAWAGTC